MMETPSYLLEATATGVAWREDGCPARRHVFLGSGGEIRGPRRQRPRWPPSIEVSQQVNNLLSRIRRRPSDHAVLPPSLPAASTSNE
jgi:hypothetical protein